MKRFFVVIAVVCLFSVPGLAGEIPTMGAPQPPPPASSTDNQNSPGEIPTGGAAASSTDPGDIPSGGFTGQIPSDGLAALLSVLSFLA